jgi:hypothetical protein
VVSPLPQPVTPSTPGVPPTPDTPTVPSTPPGGSGGDGSGSVPAPPPATGYDDSAAGYDPATYGSDYDPGIAPDAALPAPAEPWQTWDGGEADAMRTRVDVALVSGYYEHGDLGTQDEIRSAIRALPHEDGFQPKPFFNDAGHILAYDAMDADQRETFERWLASEHVQSVVAAGLETLDAPAGVPAWKGAEATDMQARVEAALVSGYFEHGDLGTEDEIRAELLGIGYGDGFEATPFFTDAGHLLSYDAMSHDQRLTFERWVESDRVQALLGDVLDAAAPPSIPPAPAATA